MKLACQNIKSNTKGPQAKACTQDSGHGCNVHWKYNCCASDCPNWRLHAGHLRCRVEIRMSIHDLQNVCRHFVSIVERMFCLHVEHLRMLMHLSTSFCSWASFCDDGTGLLSPAFLCRSIARFATESASCNFLRSVESSANAFFPSSITFR